MKRKKRKKLYMPLEWSIYGMQSRKNTHTWGMLLLMSIRNVDMMMQIVFKWFNKKLSRYDSKLFCYKIFVAQFLLWNAHEREEWDLFPTYLTIKTFSLRFESWYIVSQLILCNKKCVFVCEGKINFHQSPCQIFVK